MLFALLSLYFTRSKYRLDAEPRWLRVVECRGLPSCRRPERGEGATREPEALYNA